MKTSESESRIALQPESEVEQSLVAEIFTRLNNITEAQEHPNKVGSVLVFYTLDIGMYDGLSLDLSREADISVNGDGRLDPEPGSRALVVVHDPEAEEPVQTTDEEEEEVEAEQDFMDEAVEEIAQAESDEDNEYVPDKTELLERCKSLVDDYQDSEGGVEYSELQQAAKDISTRGALDIKANKSTEELISDIRAFIEMHEETDVAEV